MIFRRTSDHCVQPLYSRTHSKGYSWLERGSTGWSFCIEKHLLTENQTKLVCYKEWGGYQSPLLRGGSHCVFWVRTDVHRMVLHAAIGGILTGNYGMWNVYCLLMMWMYAPSVAKATTATTPSGQRSTTAPSPLENEDLQKLLHKSSQNWQARRL